MIIDARSLPDGTSLSADICIAGAGAAGITMARALAARGLKVLLVESGGLEFEQETQNLYAGEVRGYPYQEPDINRLRYFGGSTNHWGGQVRPLDPLDFAAREWVPHSGWPIGYADLEPYYAKAQELLGLPGLDGYAVRPEDTFVGRYFDGLPMGGPNGFSMIRYMENPVRFGEAFREELRRSEAVTVLLHANLTEIELVSDAGSVRGFRLATLGGKPLRATGRRYVLALGGLENARLMLASDSVERHGVGNRHDNVGRYFIDHPGYRTGRMLLARDDLCVPIEDYREDFGWGLLPAEPVQRELAALNFTLAMSIVRGEPDSVFRDFWANAVERRSLPQNAFSKAMTLIGDFDHILPIVWCQAGGSRLNYAVFDVALSGEQAPNPESRVHLGDERDALGMRRLVVDWRLSEQDRESCHAYMTWLARALGAANTGRVRIAGWLEQPGDDWADPDHAAPDHAHHCGTTRMSDDPRTGVVDRHCRVHGVGDLYVAGSSVFPTNGYANPTLTILAMAHRLADHLSGSL